MGWRLARVVPALALALAASGGLASAATGTVVHEDDSPFEGARACYVAGGVETLCATTNASGFYELPDSSIDRLRVRADGYLPVTVAGVDQARPIVMRPAASILIRLRDAASGDPVAAGTVTLLFSEGRKLGPAPVNQNGVLFRSQPPGGVVVRATSDDGAEIGTRRVTLVAGEETVVVFDVEASAPEAAD